MAEKERGWHSERCREAKDVTLIQIQRVHIHSHLMTPEDNEISNWEQSLGQHNGNNPLVISQIHTRDDLD